MEKIISRIVDELYCINDNTLMNLVQKHLQDNNLWDEKVGYMSDLDDACEGMTASEIISNLDSNFDISDAFIYVDNIGCIYSTNDLSLLVDDEIGLEEMARYIIDVGSCDIDNIQEILDEMEEEELC